MLKNLLSILFFSFFMALGWSQEPEIPEHPVDSLKQNLKEKGIVVNEAILKKNPRIDPLAPSRAAFYSAVLPGMGQIYNKKYWKLPIVYGLLGGGVAIYTYNNNQYIRVRDAFKRRKAGFTDDEFYDINGVITIGSPRLDNDDLQRAQERFQEDRDLTLLVTIALYVLNIVDANVDAHLKQFNVDDDLSMRIKPYLDYNKITANANYGLALQIKF